MHVRPPAQVEYPASVYVVDYGDTARMWLPTIGRESSAYTEWCYGDWQWYARDEHSIPYGAIVFIVPTEGTLGKRDRVVGPKKSPDVQESAEAIHEIIVERAAVLALQDAVEQRFEAHRDTEYYNPDRGILFVKDDCAYWFGNQSSTELARWLSDLGCEVSGFTVIAHFTVDPPGQTWKVGDLH